MDYLGTEAVDEAALSIHIYLFPKAKRHKKKGYGMWTIQNKKEKDCNRPRKTSQNQSRANELNGEFL